MPKRSKGIRDFSESGWEDFEQRLHSMVGDINDPNFIRGQHGPGTIDGKRRRAKWYLGNGS